ncbi:MAG: hypothetical protein QNJ13_17545 [Paracoccaceae bacterium]|nr:hypothetical protein [Paracoccaceae bacterium]
MADERKPPEEPVATPVPAPRAEAEKDRKITDNPGEGEYMFKDWALI